jgi:hypothetical protein
MGKTISKAAALVCAFAMLTFVSCTKEASEDLSGGEQATLKIIIDNPSVTKAIDTGDETVVGDVTILIVNAANQIISKYWYANPTALATANTDELITTTTLAEHVYILANLSSSTTVETTGMFASVSTLAQAQAVLYDLGSVSATNLPAFGKTASALVFAPDGSGKQTATTSVTLNLIPARIDVYVNNNMTNYSDLAAVEMKDIGIIFSGKEAYLFPKATPTFHKTTYVDNTTSLGLFASAGVYTTYPSYVPTIHTTGYTNLVSNWVVGGAWDDSPGVSSEPATFNEQYTKTFYVFPVKDKNLIVTARSTFKAGAGALAGTNKYYPVHFGTSDVGNLVVESGNKYELTINLNGDATDGTGGGGTPDPEVPVTNAFVTISVSINPWVVNTINTPKEFN